MQRTTETTISKPPTRRLEKSLLLQPLSSEETLVSTSSHDSQSGIEVKDPRPITIDAPNMQSEPPSGDVNNTPTQDEPQSYLIDKIAEYLTRDLITKETCIPIFSAFTLKKKKKMLFAATDFHELTLDALINSGAFVNCLSETDYATIQQMSLQKNGATPFKLQVANGDIETPTKTISIQFEIGDWNFKQTFIVAKRITGPILGITFLKNNSAILDVSQGLVNFPRFKYFIETDENTRNKKL